MNQETKDFIEIIVVGLILAGFLLGIISLNISEALKYSTIISLFLILAISYIRIVIVKRIDDLEKRIEKLEEKK